MSKSNRYPKNSFYNYSNNEGILKSKKQYHNYNINLERLSKFSSECFDINHGIEYHGINKIPESVSKDYMSFNDYNDLLQKQYQDDIESIVDDLLDEC